MKKGLRTFLLYLLSGLVISTSSAWSITTLQCKMSGFAHYHLGQDGCCGDLEDSSGTQLKSDCCDVDQLAFGLELVQPKLEKKDLMFEVPLQFSAVNAFDVQKDKYPSQLINAPPPEEDFQSLNCVYLV